MSSASRFFVPSPCVLRFLRAQSGELPFFDPNHPVSRRLPKDVRGSIARVTCPVRARGAPKLSARHFDTLQIRRDVALQAALFDLDSLLPRSIQKLRKRNREFDPAAPARALRHASTKDCPTDRAHSQNWPEKGLESDVLASSKSEECSHHAHTAAEEVDNEDNFFNSRQMRAKAAAEPRIRCTEVDENGKVIMVDGEFKKSELIAKYGLLTRDLRKIDSSNLPHILVRPSAILLNLLHLRVLIKHDRVLLFDVYGSKTSYPQSAFIYELQHRLQQKQPSSGGLPYEFRALEAVLMSVTSELEADFDYVQEPVVRVLSELEDDIDRDKLRSLLVLSKRMSTFEQKAKLVGDAIEELLEADDDLAAMYLTEKTRDIYRGEDDHTEVEMLLESYHKICDEVVQGAGNLVGSIRNTEEIVRAILDANRNALMLLDLKFSVGTLGLAMGTFCAGLYGMNLKNYLENSAIGFPAVTGVATIFSLIICMYGLKKLRSVQRIRMDGTEVMAHHDKMPIRMREEIAARLVEARNREKLRKVKVKTLVGGKMKGARWF